MTTLYDPMVAGVFGAAFGLGGVVCGFQGLSDYYSSAGRSPQSPRPPRPLMSPWSVYSSGFIICCMLSLVARYVQQPPTVFGTVSLHITVIALLVMVWAVCRSYARLWKRNLLS